MGHFTTLPLHHREYSISQLLLVSLGAFSKPVPVTFAFFHFLRIFFPSICDNVHQGIVFLQLHNILTPLLTTPPIEFTTSLTTFRTYFSILNDYTGYLDYFIPWKHRCELRRNRVCHEFYYDTMNSSVLLPVLLILSGISKTCLTFW